jgi:crotonobetainyl-CoA:carnitine CoA-transferase CaiB-like acyl-CoA transferase
MDRPEVTPTPAKGALDGLRVLDLGVLFAAPLCATLLGDLGADVIKIEHPKHGDPLRGFGWQKNDEALWWKMVARNKRAITLNLSDEAGQEIFLDLVEQADVVLEAFRPGTFERWNLPWERLKERNPNLILVRTSGFGQTGRYSSRPGFGTLAEAMSGFAAITGTADGPPTLPSVALADGVAALASTVMVLAALNHLRNGGEGQVVDISLVEPLFWLLGPQSTAYDQLGIVQGRTGNASVFTALRNTYQTSDGGWVAISSSSEGIAKRVLRIIGGEEMANDPRFATNTARLAYIEELNAMVAEWMAARTRDEVLAIFEEGEAAIAPVYDAADIAADEYFWEREALVRVPDPELGEIVMQGMIAKLSATPGSIRSTGPKLGQHTDEVLRERLGLDDETIERLRSSGVV